jgi:hypothetical protein
LNLALIGPRGPEPNTHAFSGLKATTSLTAIAPGSCQLIHLSPSQFSATFLTVTAPPTTGKSQALRAELAAITPVKPVWSTTAGCAGITPHRRPFQRSATIPPAGHPVPGASALPTDHASPRPTADTASGKSPGHLLSTCTTCQAGPVTADADGLTRPSATPAAPHKLTHTADFANTIR